MVYNQLSQLSKNLKSNFFFNYDTSSSTWFRAGGFADLFCLVADEKELEIILNHSRDIPMFVMGAGSNLLIRDGGFRGIIIKLGKSFNNLAVNNNFIYAGASILDLNLSKFALSNSLSNLEFFSGIPGSVGGAVKMNAGCYGSETKDVLEKVSLITKNGLKKYLCKKDLDLTYRNSNLSHNDIITSAVFNVGFGDKEKIRLKIENIKCKREKSQPLRTKTGGSTFKNPKGFHAAKLIEESDCKGLKIGEASVSTKHANFFINQNKATARDIENLGKTVQERVYKKFNITLEWEIKIIGEESD